MLEELDRIELKQILDKRQTVLPFKLLNGSLFISASVFIKEMNWKTGLPNVYKKGVTTFGDLKPGSLRVIASDLSNGKMMVIPDDLHKYNIPYESFSVAKAIRMSCSLPYFFEPVRLRTRQGKVVIVDGGVLSNFPMWLFDQENVKRKRPVIGIKLSPNYNESEPKEIHNALQMFDALFTTMKDAHDARYISRKHVKDIIFIPTDGVLMTEFALTDEKKQALINLGKERTLAFLKTWSY